MRHLTRALIATLAIAVPVTAAAGDSESAPTEATLTAPSTWRAGVGARVGGYGFRDPSAEDGLTWFDCRMDGVGLIGTLDLSRHLFTELSLDFYQATSDVVSDANMDRLSVHTLGSLGVRMRPDAFIAPFIQIGGGAEWTRVSMLDGPESADWFPVAFMGVGGELNISDNLKVGVGLRFLAMIHPEHTHRDGAHTQEPAEIPLPEPHPEIPLSFAPAAQGLGWLRFML